MKFHHIIWIMLSMNLAIGLINGLGIFTTDYMTVPADSSFELTDFQDSAGNSTMDESYLSVTGPLSGLGMLKDLALGCFNVYTPLTTIWRAPAAIAAVLQAIVAVSWAMFFIQLIMRQSWGGMEG